MPDLIRAAVVISACVLASGCGRAADTAAPMAGLDVRLSSPQAQDGSPLNVTYTFTVPGGGAALPPDQWVFVHALDERGELLWTDDHAPDTPTQNWRPGTPVVYTRTMFVPHGIRPGGVRLEAGLFSRTSGERLPLSGQNRGMRSYEVGTFAVAAAASPVVTGAGWYDRESGEGPGRDWQWSRKEGRLSFRNPKGPVTLYLQIDQPVTTLPASQAVEVRGPSGVLTTFMLSPGSPKLVRLVLTAEQLSQADYVDLTVAVAPTFVPAATVQLHSADTRELGIRLLNAFVEPGGA